MIPWRKTPEEPQRPVLDMSYLDRLSSHLGTDITGELLADGMFELADRLDRVEELTTAGDVDGLLRLTHDIAGASGHLGLSRLSAAAAAANRDLRQVEGSGARSVVQPLIDCRSASIDALGRFCRGLNPS